MIFLVILLAIALQVFLTTQKLSPFLSLLIVAIVAGFLLGMSPAAILASIEKGVGSTLGGLALIVCLGAILGKILEESGAAEQIAVTLLNWFGRRYIQWAVVLTGFIVGIPLFYNAGFIILVPLIFTLARKANLHLLYVAIPMAAALSATHCFLPPHPGPVVLVNALHANMSKTLLYGMLLTVPAVVIAGPVLGNMVGKMKTNPPALYTTTKLATTTLPAALPSFGIALLPVLLITVAGLVNFFIPQQNGFTILLHFLGDSTIALLLSVLLGAWYFGLRSGKTIKESMQWVNDGVSGIAMILLIITAGGVLKQVLVDSGADSYISSFSSRWQMPPLFFGWLVTALLRVTVGSATVAGITAAGIVTPLVAASGVSPELMVLALGTGSVFGSHVNDPGFWMFKEFFGLSLKQTFLSWTVMETLISVLGLLGVLLLNAVMVA